MKRVIFVFIAVCFFNTLEAQVKPTLTEREQQIVYNACDNFDKYYSLKKTSTGLTISGFVLSGVGIAIVNSEPAAGLTGAAIGGALFFAGWITDRSASKQIKHASNELRLLTNEVERFELPETLE